MDDLRRAKTNSFKTVRILKAKKTHCKYVYNNFKKTIRDIWLNIFV